MEIAQMATLSTMDISAKQALERVYKYAVPRNFIVGSASAFAAWYVPLFFEAYNSHFFQKSLSSLLPDVNLFKHNVFSVMLSPLVYPEVPVKDLALSTRIPAFFITSITLNVLAQLIFGDKDKKQDVQQPVSTLPPSVSSEPVRRVSDSSKKEMAVVETKN